MEFLVSFSLAFRIPLTSENDEDDDGGGDCGGDCGGDDWRTKCYSRIASETSPDVASSLSRQSLSLRQCNLEVLLPKEDNQNTCVSSYSEQTSSVDVLPKGRIVLETLCSCSSDFLEDSNV